MPKDMLAKYCLSLGAHKGLADSQGLQTLQTTNDKDYKDLQAYQATTEQQYFSRNWYQVYCLISDLSPDVSGLMSWNCLGVVWLGKVLQRFGANLGVVFERSWSVLERSWGVLEQSWSVLERSWSVMG